MGQIANDIVPDANVQSNTAQGVQVRALCNFIRGHLDQSNPLLSCRTSHLLPQAGVGRTRHNLMVFVLMSRTFPEFICSPSVCCLRPLGMIFGLAQHRLVHPLLPLLPTRCKYA